MSKIILTGPQAAPPAFDLDYICRVFGLIQVGGDYAVNPNCIQYIGRVDDGSYYLRLNDGHTLNLHAKDMPELEATIRKREAEIHQARAEAITREAQMTAAAQMQATTEAIQNAQIAGKLQRRRGQ